jgi:hypothetical protein
MGGVRTMSTHLKETRTVIVERYILEDLAWLLDSLGEFVRLGNAEAVHELLGFANEHLSADGLTYIVNVLAARLVERLEVVR